MHQVFLFISFGFVRYHVAHSAHTLDKERSGCTSSAHVGALSTIAEVSQSPQWPALMLSITKDTVSKGTTNLQCILLEIPMFLSNSVDARYCKEEWMVKEAVEERGKGCKNQRRENNKQVQTV
jgi:hypothetical protein